MVFSGGIPSSPQSLGQEERPRAVAAREESRGGGGCRDRRERAGTSGESRGWCEGGHCEKL